MALKNSPSVARLVGCALLAIGLGACNHNSTIAPDDPKPAEGETQASKSGGSAPTGSGPWLVDATAALGIAAPTTRWPDGAYLTPEITPGGVALLDYDSDGDLDVYQVRHCAPVEMPHAFQGAAPNRLFQQMPNGGFEEVADAAGLADAGYGHGCAVGDIDNDGDVDVFVAQLRSRTGST